MNAFGNDSHVSRSSVPLKVSMISIAALSGNIKRLTAVAAVLEAFDLNFDSYPV